MEQKHEPGCRIQEYFIDSKDPERARLLYCKRNCSLFGQFGCKYLEMELADLQRKGLTACGL